MLKKTFKFGSAVVAGAVLVASLAIAPTAQASSSYLESEIEGGAIGNIVDLGAFFAGEAVGVDHNGLAEVSNFGYMDVGNITLDIPIGGGDYLELPIPADYANVEGNIEAEGVAINTETFDLAASSVEGDLNLFVVNGGLDASLEVDAGAITISFN